MKKRKVKNSPSSKKSASSSSATDSRSQFYFGYKILFAVIVVVLAIALVYLVIPSKYSGRRKSSQQEYPSSSKKGDGGFTSEEQDGKEIDCKAMIPEARRLVDTRPQSEWNSAVALLVDCIRQDPSDSAAYWNMAIVLLRRGEHEDAIEFMTEALRLDPENLDYLKSSGFVFVSLESYSKAILSLEKYLEVTLNMPSWEQLLIELSVQREDEWEFLHDGGEDILQVFGVLQSAYLKEKVLIKASCLYKIIVGLKGEEVEKELLSSYAFFAFGLGDFVTGIRYLRFYTEKQYVTAGYGSTEQASDVVQAHALRLFVAGLELYVSSIASNLLAGGEKVWEELSFNCGLGDADSINFTTRVYQAEVRKLAIGCIDKQNVVRKLLKEEALVYADNHFGWTPILHASFLGSPRMVRTLLDNRADPTSRTGLGHTSLHIAAMRGTFDVIPVLLKAGVPSDEVDYFKRSPLKIACLHRWSVEKFAESLKQNLPEDCLQNPIYHPPPKLSMFGGWLPRGNYPVPSALSLEGCDFDVMSVADAKVFLYDYLSLQRPVIVRNASNAHSMKKLYYLWHRSRLAREYGEEVFKFSQADQSGLVKDQTTTLKDFLVRLNKYYEELSASPTEDKINPMHIYSPLPSASPLLQHFSNISVLDQNITGLSPFKFHFFLGTQLSGVPMQFHRSSWHLLVYGQNRWFLHPPDRAYISNEPIWKWWRDSYSQTSEQALECVQYPGDLVFVPETWGYGYISLRESIGVASEFIYGVSEFSI